MIRFILIIIIFINNQMGKNTKQVIAAAKQQEVDPIVEIEKQPLHKWVPYKKHIIRKAKKLKTVRKEIIKSIELDKFLIESAVKCLQEYSTRSKSSDLFDSPHQYYIYLEICLSEVPTEYSIRPIQIALPVPIYTEEIKSRIAIFCCDPEQQYAAKLEKMNIPLVSQIIGYERIKKNYKNIKDKQTLLEGNDLFFCDWKLYNLLRKPLGKLFYENKKYPYPIDCDGEIFNEQFINGLTNFTYFMMGNGPVYTVKIGRLNMDVRDLVKNVIHGAYNTLPHVLAGKIQPSKVRQISIKGYNTPSFPIYNSFTPSEISIWKNNN